MRSNAYETIKVFEREVASFCGSKFAVATDSCTSAIFLSCKYRNAQLVLLPARTYISVPFAVIHSGGRVGFDDLQWRGSYKLEPYDIYDSALRFRRGMYRGGLECLSFQMKKLLPIGKGGMILTDSEQEAKWLLKARSNGRNWEVPFEEDNVDMVGWNMAPLPEQAARGLQLLEACGDGFEDQSGNYPDLRRMPVFRS